jgi:hypothetical protein
MLLSTAVLAELRRLIRVQSVTFTLTGNDPLKLFHFEETVGSEAKADVDAKTSASTKAKETKPLRPKTFRTRQDPFRSN